MRVNWMFTAVEPSFVDSLEARLPALRASAFLLCGDNALADDLVEATIKRAWATASGFDAATSMRIWLLRILRRELRKAAADAPTASERALMDRPGARPDWMSGLRALPLLQREALVLLTAAEMTLEEAASVLGLHPGEVSSLASRAHLELAARS